MAPLYFVTERKGIKRKYAILVKNGDRYRGFFKEGKAYDGKKS